MSVINKMLRDLDAGQRSGRVPVSQDTVLADVTRGTMSLAGYGQTDGPRAVRSNWLIGALLIVTAAAVAWIVQNEWSEWRTEKSVLTKSSQVPVAPAGVPPASPSSVPVTQPISIASALPIAPASSPPGSSTVFVPATTPPPVAVEAPPLALASSTAALVRVAAPQLPSAKPSSPVTRASKSSVSVAATAPAPTQPAPQRAPSSRSQDAMDAAAESQALWDRGAREAALQLLRDKVDVADPLAMAGGSPDVLWLWVRELTRMEMALGRLGQSLDRLVRLESALSNQAVAWAMRGNLAQRLGRNGESAKAYQTALELRPGEPRWMLGAAVSLAADGNTTLAAEFAAKAQDRGALSPEVATYLRQQGVALR